MRKLVRVRARVCSCAFYSRAVDVATFQHARPPTRDAFTCTSTHACTDGRMVGCTHTRTPTHPSSRRNSSDLAASRTFECRACRARPRTTTTTTNVCVCVCVCVCRISRLGRKRPKLMINVHSQRIYACARKHMHMRAHAQTYALMHTSANALKEEKRLRVSDPRSSSKVHSLKQQTTAIAHL